MPSDIESNSNKKKLFLSNLVEIVSEFLSVLIKYIVESVGLIIFPPKYTVSSLIT